MIKIERNPDEPSVLSSVRVTRTKEQLSETIGAGRRPTGRNFKSHWRDDQLRDQLWVQQKRKCCYCEAVRGRRREIDVEHYRPKAKIAEDHTHLGYWWLAYSWNNLLYACKYCNQEYKKNYFPLLPGGQRASAPDDNLVHEMPALLNPYEDSPETCLGYEWVRSKGQLVEVTGVDDEGRGTESIKLYGLNRDQLAINRAELVEDLQILARTMEAVLHAAQTEDLRDKVEEMGDKVRRATSAKKSFSGFRRYYFRERGLYEYVSDD